MDLTNPYEKNYFPESILKGLNFYYQLLSKANIRIYSNQDLPQKRKDIQLSINFLSSLPKESDVNNFCFSHPQLTIAMESIESFSSFTLDKLSDNEMKILFCLEHLLFTATNIMFFKAKFDIPKAMHNLSVIDKIKFLIKNKYLYIHNESAFPTKFREQAIDYCDSLIKEYRELYEAEKSNFIHEEVKKINNNQINTNQSLHKNDTPKKKKRSKPSNKIRALLQKEINSTCPFCPSRDVDHFEIHHIDEIPSNNEIENLLMLCPTCHSKITKGDISKDIVTTKKLSLREF